MSPWLYALPAVGYFYGAVPFSFLAAKLLKGVDIRTVSSGNVGATNAARVLGFKFFPVLFLLDMSKGLLPTLAGRALAPAGRYDPPLLAVATGLAAVLGHMFPIYLGFRGGKAVATGAGVCVVLCPWAAAAGAAVWGVVFAAFRYVSLASVCGAAAVGVSAWLFHRDPLGEGLVGTAFLTLASALVILRHRANIRRLLAGTEPKVQRGASRPREADSGGRCT